MTTIADICAMYLLLTAATNAEIQPCLDFLENNNFTVSGHQIEVLTHGVGSVATTYLLTHHINNNRPDLVIQAGIAGSFTELDPGRVVAVSTDSFGDLGVWENDQFRTVFDLRLADDNDPPFTNSYLSNPYQRLLQVSELDQVMAITVNEISTDARKIAWYKQYLQPVVESMEGAALHYVCLRENIPFIQLRSISNRVGERDKTKWNIGAAIGALNEKLISLIKELSNYDETYFRL